MDLATGVDGLTAVFLAAAAVVAGISVSAALFPRCLWVPGIGLGTLGALVLRCCPAWQAALLGQGTVGERVTFAFGALLVLVGLFFLAAQGDAWREEQLLAHEPVQPTGLGTRFDNITPLRPAQAENNSEEA